MAKRDGYVTLKMPSKEVRLLHENCFATIGVLANESHSLKVEGKAGRVRWKFRPTVRGTAMSQSTIHMVVEKENTTATFHEVLGENKQKA